MYRQITAHLRELIRSGELKPGTRLPTARAMAKEWGTNHFTIQLALTPLVNEGLVERSRRRGTFVRDQTQKLASIAIYYGGNLWLGENVFYQLLYKHIAEIYRERKSRAVLFVEERSKEDTDTIPADLRKAIDQREVQGVLAFMLYRQPEWLLNLPVPVALFGGAGMHQDRFELFDLVISRFAADGCKTVGMLCPRIDLEWKALFKSLAERAGMRVLPNWTRGMENRDLHHEFAGYNLFKELWATGEHPDGVFVFPDIACRGMMIAALELGLKVPEDLRVIFHRNTGVDYLCPWKIPYLVTDVRDVAQAMIDYLDAQHREGPLPPPLLKSKLID